MTRRKTAFISLWPSDERQAWADTLALESEPVTKLLEESAYLEMLLRARINDAALANLLAFARDKDLERLGEFYGVERFEGESDTALRERIIERIRASSTAGPAAHYRYHGLSASPDVADVHIDSPRAGLVRVSVIAKDGQADATLVDTVRAHLMRDDIRVLTDTLDVRAASVQRVDVSATIYLLPDAAVIDVAQIETRLREAVGTQLGLGRDLTRSWLISTLHTQGVQNVVLHAPSNDIVIDNDQAAAIGDVNITFAERGY
ncbi:baseplate assembly protein [Rappaport israeli]|uniref:baseplate assembly protein n=1 Tax=Rappaport israeli TaxID=1839807 RepID=UPI0013018CF3|nr:baseplate J/gp47 family protein [Rappaport israeli]